jgi:hypothetical protein
VVIERWTTASSAGLGPLAGDQPPVPPQERIRRHQEGRPAPAGKRSAQHCQQRTVGGSELGPLDPAAQHLELVAQNRDLDVLGMLGLEANKQEAEESARDEVEEGQGHRRILA